MLDVSERENGISSTSPLKSPLEKVEILKTIMEFYIKGRKGKLPAFSIIYHINRILDHFKGYNVMHKPSIWHIYDILWTTPKQPTTTFIAEVAPRISDSNLGALLHEYNEISTPVKFRKY